MFDVIIDCFGVFAAPALPKHLTTLKHLTEIKPNRLLIVGGQAAYIRIKATQYNYMIQKIFRQHIPLATAMGKELEFLRKVKDV